MSIQAQVTAVQTRQVNGARGPFDLHEVFLNGQAHVAKKDVWELARGLQGQVVQAETRTEQNGRFTNYYLDAIGGTDTARYNAPVAVAQTTSVPASFTMVTSSPAPSQGSTERDLQIWRQVAAKVSAHMSNTPQEFWANLDDLMRYFETGAKPNEQATGFDPNIQFGGNG